MSHEAHEGERATKDAKNTKAFLNLRALRDLRGKDFVVFVARTKR